MPKRSVTVSLLSMIKDLRLAMIGFFIIISISLFTFLPSFNLALFGDDWLAFWRYAQHLGPKSSGQFNHLTYFLTPYGAQDILMGFLRNVFGFESTSYYVLSFIFRAIAAISFYPLVYYLTKSKLASYFAVLFFSITTVGLDTTNWVFNMPSYVTIALFNVFLYFFLKSREEKKIKLLILGATFYYLAYITTPIRMHGSLLFIFLLEVFWIFQNKNLQVAKTAALRFSVILIVFLIIRFTGQSQGPPQEPMERFIIGLTQDIQMLSQGRFDFIVYPVMMFGGMFIPDFILPFTQPIGSMINLSLKIILPTFLGFLLLAFLIIKNTSIPKTRFLKLIMLTGIIWSIFIVIVYKTNLTTFSDPKFSFLSLIGGYIFILAISFLIKFFKQTNISTGLFLAMSWSILSFFFAWFWVPQSIFPTTYRYLIVSTSGISILLATIISCGKNTRSKLLLSSLFTFLIIVHIFSSRFYLDTTLNSHGQEISKKIWSSIPYVIEIGKSKEPIIFYFEGDGTNGGILHDVITFGFPPHMALLYNLREEDGGFPVPMSDFKEVISAVTDGKVMKAYGYPEKRVPLERIYAFHLKGKDNLVNITTQAREKLKEYIQ